MPTCRWPRAKFQSTRPSRGETADAKLAADGKNISIHSPLAGRDLCQLEMPETPIISIHSPLAGRDFAVRNSAARKCQFQSTRPSRGETTRRAYMMAQYLISIHSPLAGRDAGIWAMTARSWYFNPLAPRGARPQTGTEPDFRGNISIHSPLAGRDRASCAGVAFRAYFNPLAPRGARRSSSLMSFIGSLFQSTRPSRGETKAHYLSEERAVISIHSPLAGRDP